MMTMRKCTFKAVDSFGREFDRILITTTSYEQAVYSACNWFKGLRKREGLHLITTARFKYRMLSKPAFDRVCHALKSACPGVYDERREGANANRKFLPMLDANTMLAIIGSAMPSSVRFPYTGTNHNIYLWLELNNRAGIQLMPCLSNRDYDDLIGRLHKLHVVFLDLVDSCLNVNNSGSDDDILCYTIDNEMVNKLKVLHLEKGKMISVSGAVSETLKEVLQIETDYCGLVRNPKKGDWFPRLQKL